MPHPRAWRPFILVASYVFYGWIDWRWVLLLMGSTLVNTVAARVIATQRRQAHAQARADRGDRRSTSACSPSSSTWASSSSRWTTRSTRSALARRCRSLQIILPIGISFFTFQAISYVVDVYRGDTRAASLGDVAILQAFFPHLVAGPIVRANELLPQLRTPRDPREVLAGPGPVPDRRRPDQEDRGRRRAGTADRRPGLQRSRRPLRARGADRRSTASRPRSSATSRATPTWRSGIALLLGFQLPQNFDSPYIASQPPGLLAPLAHVALALAARLPLHPARRQPPRRAAARTAT